MLRHFAKSQHDAPPTLRLQQDHSITTAAGRSSWIHNEELHLGRVFVVESVLEADELLQQERAAVVDVFVEHLVAVSESRRRLRAAYTYSDSTRLEPLGCVMSGRKSIATCTLLASRNSRGLRKQKGHVMTTPQRQ